MLWQLRDLSWPEVRHQPWRHASAVLAVVLGVALAFAVHLINASALAEFDAAVRQVHGEADFSLQAQAAGFDEALYARVARHPGVALASPVIDLDVVALAGDGTRVALRLIGQDALVAPQLAPSLRPEPERDADRLAWVDPDRIYLNDAAIARLGNRTVQFAAAAAAATTPTAAPDAASGPGAALSVAGRIAAAGGPTAVIDIAGAQAHFGWLGRVSRIDVRLEPGAARAAVLAALALPAGVVAVTPAEGARQVSNVSRAYRVNLTVLALVALFTGAFLVYSILSLSVARRVPQLALLGVLGLAAQERLRLVLAESALMGTLGSALGIALGTGLAGAALRLLGGDLGGGYFPGVAPTLRFDVTAAAAYGALGVAAAVVGGWLPARQAARFAPAQALKGLGGSAARARGVHWIGPAALAGGAALAFLPPIAGLPLGAYVAVALLLVGGIACVPLAVAALTHRTAPPRAPLWLLALQRARHDRDSATVAVAGVVASLALAVALTVMVASFRDALTLWLDTVLPADVYVRLARPEGSRAASDALPTALVAGASGIPGVVRAETQRAVSVQVDRARAPVVLISRPLPDPAAQLPLVGPLQPARRGAVAGYASEALVSLYGARAGSDIELPLPDGRTQRFHVRGIWRDYARQSGALMIDADDYERLTGDATVNDLALWVAPGADLDRVQQALRAQAGPAGGALEFASAAAIRTRSLQIFDRSFAVTYWLQAVAVAIGLFGIAASFSAQVLARRREFGLLMHLGLTRRDVLTLVVAEGAVWCATGAALGLLLGIAVSVVLVKVVNPQSFHWTMPLLLPAGRLALLAAAVLLAGTATAWLSARRAIGRDLALAVKEDW